MMDTFKKIKFWTHFVILLISITSNLILIFLVSTKSPPKIGSYKYLMWYFAILSLVYSMLDFLVQPYVHSHGSSFAMIMDLENTIFQNFPKVAFTLVCFLSGCFGATIYAITINFVFRFFALQREGRLRFFQGRYLIIWLSTSVFIGFLTTIKCWTFSPNTELSEYLRADLRDEHGIDVDKTTYTGYLYYHTDEYGNMEIDSTDIFLIIWFFCLMIVPFIIIVYFGTKSYSKIKELISKGESEYSRRLQAQLYKALVAQTLIPMIFLFFPLGINFIAPILGLDVEFASMVITFLYSFYPAMDPIPIIFMVDDYRNTFLNFFRRIFSKNQLASVELYDADNEYF